jgi:Flp pilus assembly protein TadG
MVLVAIAMVAIVAMAAMSIDLVTLYLAREEAQRAADAAALSAARLISVSGITGTGDPDNQSNYWKAICGTSGLATQAAQAVGGQNGVGGIGGNIIVNYSDGSSSASDCSTLSTVFAVNPLVTVQVQRSSIPTFFSRIWGVSGNPVSATATAEAFNPSASDITAIGASGSVTPVQPKCVKPWMVPNLDPGNPPNPFVALTNGAIQNKGISLGGLSAAGVIGEQFSLFADCSPGAPCAPVNTPPAANVTSGNFVGGSTLPPLGNNLEYLPGAAPPSVLGVPSCATGGPYQMAVAGCDQTTVYQCGVASSIASPPNQIDLSENPGGGAGDTALGAACSMTRSATVPTTTQDLIDVTAYPFSITAGSTNLAGLSGTPITSSSSIVALPIYDQSVTLGTGVTPVTILGFLQVFINQVNADGSLLVTVLNVAGCGNAATNTAVIGSSPVPVRLITPPPSQGGFR